MKTKLYPTSTASSVGQVASAVPQTLRLMTVVFLSAWMLFASSCASFLNPKFQKVEIKKPNKSDEILVNGKKAKTKAGKVLLERDMLPKQITLKSKGTRDQNIVVMQYKKSNWHILSWIPFGITLYVPFYDKGPKSWNYDKKPIVFKKAESLATKKDEEKFIKINKLGIELDNSAIKSRYFPNYRSFVRNEKNFKAEASSDIDEDIQIENTEFSLALNQMLKDKGYIDTSRTALKNSFLRNLAVNATVKDYTIHHVANKYFSRYGGMIYIDLTIEWQILDYYESVIHKTSTKCSSGQFAILDYSKRDKPTQNALKDVVEASFINLMKQPKVYELLTDNSDVEREKNFTSIGIPGSSAYVSSLPEAVKSTVTVKKENSFGSGFIIGREGYIITNYHVVSDSGDTKVVLNDGREFDAEIVRVSKIYDLAVLKINASDLVPFKINLNEKLNVAADIYAVGTPSAEDLSQTVTKGIVSGFRTQGEGELIQTDASINFGNSGGPLVGPDGVVQGIVSSKLNGFGVEGVAFGIPASYIKEKLKLEIY
ncbi:MAG TPA: trypsin-like peptidase domain-containing protein [Luteibaculaceae bacterium]|nr:trypsin-like peptidase domain-containing protein [Luteibaculaceae bacterium]